RLLKREAMSFSFLSFGAVTGTCKEQRDGIASKQMRLVRASQIRTVIGERIFLSIGKIKREVMNFSF
ncbi:MAG: hypothetical protein K2N53_00100, partial [Clostridia bacterium]|nr:hypothetical protein [Clostridia bacterium]